MAEDASHVLGAPQVAGTVVNPKGMAKRTTPPAASVALGGAHGAGAHIEGSFAGVPELPSFDRVGYLAASADELVLVRAKAGSGAKVKIGGEALARVDRAHVATVALDERPLLSHLTIRFSDGGAWEFEIPKTSRKGAQAFQRAVAPADD